MLRRIYLDTQDLVRFCYANHLHTPGASVSPRVLMPHTFRAGPRMFPLSQSPAQCLVHGSTRLLRSLSRICMFDFFNTLVIC